MNVSRIRARRRQGETYISASLRQVEVSTGFTNRLGEVDLEGIWWTLESLKF